MIKWRRDHRVMLQNLTNSIYVSCILLNRTYYEVSSQSCMYVTYSVEWCCRQAGHVWAGAPTYAADCVSATDRRAGRLSTLWITLGAHRLSGAHSVLSHCCVLLNNFWIGWKTLWTSVTSALQFWGQGGTDDTLLFCVMIHLQKIRDYF